MKFRGSRTNRSTPSSGTSSGHSLPSSPPKAPAPPVQTGLKPFPKKYREQVAFLYYQRRYLREQIKKLEQKQAKARGTVALQIVTDKLKKRWAQLREIMVDPIEAVPILKKRMEQRRLRREAIAAGLGVYSGRELEQKYQHLQASQQHREKTPARQARMLLMLLREKSKRLMSGLALYRPLPYQELFHRSNAPERLIVGPNRGGKTTAAAAEVAMAALGKHPYLTYPTNGDMRVYCVAKNEKKIGEVMFRKLFMRGAYRLVFDRETGYYRQWEPWRDGYDLAQTVPSLPFIPREQIAQISWIKKRENCPSMVKLKNGCEISFFTSAGRPVEGVDLDLVWFNEEIYSGPWYDEMAARLVDRSGRFIWDATPQAATEELWNLHETAEKYKGDPTARVQEFTLPFDENPYIPTKQKELLKLKYANNPEQYDIRIRGKFRIASQRVYPNFNVATHGCEPFTVPGTWTRYIVVDPGFANSVALFFAVPPLPSQRIFIYDELYCHGVDVREFARQLKDKMAGQAFEAFLIDRHGSRRSESNGKTIGQQYSEALAEFGLRSHATGSSFRLVGDEGNLSINPGVQQVRSWLWNLNDGKPRLQVFHAYCPQLVEEMRHYRNKINPRTGRPIDKPDQDKYSHGPDCCRYACEANISYVEPKHTAEVTTRLDQYLAAKLKRRNKDRKFIALN